MKRSSVLFAMLALLSLGAPADAEMDHDHTHDHGHATVEAVDIVPSVEISEVSVDSMSGYNIYIETTNFTFAPEREGEAHVPGEGHIHLYINGTKITRLYAAGWHHISGAWLKEGENILVVTLSANTHGEYQYEGRSLSAMSTLHVH